MPLQPVRLYDSAMMVLEGHGLSLLLLVAGVVTLLGLWVSRRRHTQRALVQSIEATRTCFDACRWVFGGFLMVFGMFLMVSGAEIAWDAHGGAGHACQYGVFGARKGWSRTSSECSRGEAFEIAFDMNTE